MKYFSNLFANTYLVPQHLTGPGRLDFKIYPMLVELGKGFLSFETLLIYTSKLLERLQTCNYIIHLVYERKNYGDI